MTISNPTTHLRFVEKDIMVPHERYANVSNIKTVNILQQKWEETDEKTGEITEVWKDVQKVAS